MDGFDLETAYGQKIPAEPEYGYVPHQETRPYFEMAQQYVLADRMFTSQSTRVSSRISTSSPARRRAP